MGLKSGEIRRAHPNDVAEMFMISAHNMPLLGGSAARVCGIVDFPWDPAEYFCILLSDNGGGERDGAASVSEPG